ncbi:thioredoxin family protein [Robiginitalea sp. SC105]|uniref:thioredoxin family protein n=1 Tax=Robiginitalea sp. SC105 TaxID=2762332 RepID=UPI00163ABFDC|nr:thioredoxin family protein [Robiginitalea sp. SC105]MBC2839124.1 thioredoxin family protein [Robiginitalea sp. SC105]
MKTIPQTLLLLAFLSLSVFPVFSQGYAIGDKAADFALPAVDGNTVSLSDFPDARGFIVVFTCNTCPYAQAYEQRIEALNRQYASRGFPVIAINPNNPSIQPGDSFEKMKERAAQRGFTFPYLLDEGQEVYPRYGATRTPHVFLLERSGGDLLVRYIGAVDDNYQDAKAVETPYVEAAVEALLSGRPVPMETTRAIGCSIKA